jgi:hypothetical protein
MVRQATWTANRRSSEFPDLHLSQHTSDADRNGVELEVYCLPAGMFAVLIRNSPDDTMYSR